MSLQSDLIQRLIQLNTAAGARIYHQQIPQGEPLSVIATSEISGNRPTTLSGTGLLARSQIRVAVFARTAAEMDLILDAIKDEFRDFRQNTFIGNTRVSSVRAEVSSDEVALSDGDNVIKGKALDLFFVYY